MCVWTSLTFSPGAVQVRGEEEKGFFALLCGWSGHLRLTASRTDLDEGYDPARKAVKMWGAFLDVRRAFPDCFTLQGAKVKT